jgi:GxxExxY protein
MKDGIIFKHGELTGQVIEAFYMVYNRLGYGFLEKVYENALALELRKRGLHLQQQMPISVYYEGMIVGEYFADLLVEACVIVEIKAVERLCEEHSIQLLNYLKATAIEVGLLVNFGPKPETKRKVFESARPIS